MTESFDVTRRDFLSSRGAVAAAVAAGAALAEEPETPVPSPSVRRETPVVSLSRTAMACRFEVYLPAAEGTRLSRAAAALDEVDRLERQMSIYREDSEVSRINRRAAVRAVRVEHGLFRLFQLAQRITRETGGAFDIAAGALVRAWGFVRGPKRVPSDAELAEAMACVGMEHVELDAAARTIRFDRPGVELNLGSIGKGRALDRAAEAPALRTAANFLLHAGHSSVLARGDAEGGQGWWVGLTDPGDPSRRIGRLRLRNAAMSVSTSTFRFFEHGGRRYGHTLDPRTGRPVEGAAMTVAVAATAAEADALSTAFAVGGVEAARAYCAARPGTGAIIVPDPAGTARTGPVVAGVHPEDLEWSAPPASAERGETEACFNREPEV
jgi:thiamine biosynthesis lipoprotein